MKKSAFDLILSGDTSGSIEAALIGLLAANSVTVIRLSLSASFLNAFVTFSAFDLLGSASELTQAQEYALPIQEVYYRISSRNLTRLI